MLNTRTLLLAPVTLVIAVVAVVLMIAPAGAQAPPLPPGLFFGPVSGGPEPGDSIVAFVPGNRSLNCGYGEVTEDDEGNTVYVIDVFADDGGDYRGCGTEGSEVSFYFPDTKQFANERGTWTVPDDPDEIAPLSLTVGDPLEIVNYAPNSASDKPID